MSDWRSRRRAAAVTPSPRSSLRATVEAIEAVDRTEQDHLDDALAWLDGDEPIYRTAKPATPPKHLVSYALLVDPVRLELLLIDHRSAGLWLPTGGHVVPGEAPYDAAARELTEELGVPPDPLGACGRQPFFLTVTRTVGPPPRHVDVSLWFAFAGTRDMTLEVDEREAAGARWWAMAEIPDAGTDGFDPHLARATVKLRTMIDG